MIDYARLVARLCDKDIAPQISGEYRFGDTRHTFSSWEALGALGWRPEISLQTTIAQYLDWVRQQPNLRDFYADSEKKMKAVNVIRSAAP